MKQERLQFFIKNKLGAPVARSWISSLFSPFFFFFPPPSKQIEKSSKRIYHDSKGIFFKSDQAKDH